MKAIRGLAMVHVPTSPAATTVFAGRTLLARSLALAGSVGLRAVLVAHDAAALPDLPPEVIRLAPGERLPPSLPPNSTVLAWRCDEAFVAGLLRELLADQAPRERVLLDDIGRVAIVRTDFARLAGGVPEDPGSLAAALPGHAVDARHRCIAIATDAAEGRPPRVAESALVATLVNPRDGLFDRLLNRPISQAITPRLLRLPVTPNQVTLLSLAVGGLAAAALARPGFAWPVAGALLMQATAVLDCMDGEIARAKVLESAWGERLDVTSDSLIHVLAFLGIAVHEWPRLGARLAWTLGAMFAIGGLLAFAVVTRAERTEDRWKPIGSPAARLLGGMLATLTTRDLSMLVLAAALLGLLRPLLVGAAFGAQGFWVLALLLHGHLMREVGRREAVSAAAGFTTQVGDQSRSVSRQAFSIAASSFEGQSRTPTAGSRKRARAARFSSP